MDKKKDRSQLDLWDMRKAPQRRKHPDPTPSPGPSAPPRSRGSTTPSRPQAPKRQTHQETPRQEAPQPDVFTVKQIVGKAASVLERHFRRIWVEGEVSNCNKSPSGHLYFTLKDDSAQLSVIMFRSSVRKLKTLPETGQKVRCRGRLSIYSANGRFQLYADWVERTGLGELLAALERLKKKLSSEGLFDRALKKPLPPYPKVVGVVTSPVGAALRDIHKVLWRRWPVRLILSPAPVQGADAPIKLVNALQRLDRLPEVDVIVFGRGGGSTEDLAAFSDERVVRAVAACRHPIISAVGHEVDIALSDLAADRRAPTPSAAAEIAVPRLVEIQAGLRAQRKALHQRMGVRIEQNKLELSRASRRFPDPSRALRESRQSLDGLAGGLLEAIKSRLRRAIQRQRRGLESLRLTHPSRKLKIQSARLGTLQGALTKKQRASLEGRKQNLNLLKDRLKHAGVNLLSGRRRRLARANGHLEGLNPLSVLERGYSLVSIEDGALLRDSREVVTGQQVQIRLHRGALDCTVDEVTPPSKEAP